MFYLPTPLQDLVEAKSNVNKRVEYIKSEIERLNKQHAALEEKAKNKEQDVSFSNYLLTCFDVLRSCVSNAGHEQVARAVQCALFTHVLHGAHYRFCVATCSKRSWVIRMASRQSWRV